MPKDMQAVAWDSGSLQQQQQQWAARWRQRKQTGQVSWKLQPTSADCMQSSTTLRTTQIGKLSSLHTSILGTAVAAAVAVSSAG
jgi:hypothetical protein